jgi:hypothetical protein
MVIEVFCFYSLFSSGLQPSSDVSVCNGRIRVAPDMHELSGESQQVLRSMQVA